MEHKLQNGLLNLNLNSSFVLKFVYSLEAYSFDLVSSSGFLNFLSYRAIRKMRTQSESSLLSAVRSSRGERILEVDGTVTTQPVLEHVGISTWPGR